MVVERRGERLLAFARRLQRASTFSELLEFARDEAREVVGYNHVWLLVADDEAADTLRLIDFSGGQREIVWSVCPVLHVKGDAFLEEIVSSDTPVVIEDARTDPRTDKRMVEKLQNRTLINMPLRLVDKPLGVFGVGTFGEEGCRAPTAEELEYLVGMASQLGVAASRIRYFEAMAVAAKERQEFEHRLLQIQKLESLGMLAGGIAHDFNNLLTVVMASAALAESQITDPRLLADIQVVQGAAKRGTELTRQLLAMSRAQDLTLQALDLNAQIRQVVMLVKRLFPENIQLDLIEGVGLPLVEGDASQIDQVVLNLLINARDAMPKGGRLTIETEQVLINGNYAQTHPWAKPGRYVLTSVTDTGVGMTREVADRVFEPFFTTKGARVGTGLGLAVAYGIVRQHRGMLQCYSELGVGTTFKVYLPVFQQLATAVGTKLQEPIGRGRERVLVAEDDGLVRAVVVRILEDAGYRVTVAEDGDAACSVASQESFDLFILDVVMPGMGCRDLIARIVALQPQAHILLSSGYTACSNVAWLTDQTGLELLRKPYDPDQLLRAVRKALDKVGPPPSSAE